MSDDTKNSGSKPSKPANVGDSIRSSVIKESNNRNSGDSGGGSGSGGNSEATGEKSKGTDSTGFKVKR